jgi:hypothetical protein
MTEIPHLNLQAAMKLNPKLQCWRWNAGFELNHKYVPGWWAPVDNPKWLPYYVYAVTSSEKDKPSWTPPDPP